MHYVLQLYKQSCPWYLENRDCSGELFVPIFFMNMETTFISNGPAFWGTEVNYECLWLSRMTRLALCLLRSWVLVLIRENVLHDKCNILPEEIRPSRKENSQFMVCPAFLCCWHHCKSNRNSQKLTEILCKVLYPDSSSFFTLPLIVCSCIMPTHAPLTPSRLTHSPCIAVFLSVTSPNHYNTHLYTQQTW